LIKGTGLIGVPFSRRHGAPARGRGDWPEDFIISPDPAPPGPTPRPRPAATGDILILAALPDPAGADRGHETITLLNTTPTPIDLTGWTLADTAGGRQHLDGTLPGGAALQLTAGPAIPLGNRGDHLLLADPTGTTIDQVTYTDRWPSPTRPNHLLRPIAPNNYHPDNISCATPVSAPPPVSSADQRQMRVGLVMQRSDIASGLKLGTQGRPPFLESQVKQRSRGGLRGRTGRWQQPRILGWTVRGPDGRCGQRSNDVDADRTTAQCVDRSCSRRRRTAERKGSVTEE